jgi:O-methyltransferase domain/Dimerisation domain
MTNVTTTPTDIDRMMRMITGHWVTQIVHAAATYSLADHFAKGPATAAEIAVAEGTDPSATFRFLRACASLGMLTYDSESRFVGTSLLDTLRKDNPLNVRGMAMSMPAPGHWLPWGRFTEVVRAGQSQAAAVLGCEVWEYFATHQTEGAAFTQAMTSLTSTVAAETARSIDTSAVKVAADIGGAEGAMIHALLRENPKLQGIVFDRPQVAASAASAAKELGFDDRLAAVAGDFFESVPEADLYLLKYILHDWDDASCVRILQNCRRAMRPGARIAVIELLLGEIGEPGLAPMMDINMMVMVTGRERSLREYQKLFNAAGLGVSSVIPTKTPMVIIEGIAHETQ